MHRSANRLLSASMLLFGGLAVPTVHAAAQAGSAHLRFEVASVKPSATTGGRSLMEAVQGRLNLSNMALRRLILVAYGIQDYQLAGDPDWINTQHFDIQAKAEGNPSVQQLEGPMLQALLEDRFKLATHRETRQLPVYQLTVGKGTSRLPLSIPGSCTLYDVTASPPSTPPGGPRLAFCGFKLTTDHLNRTIDGTSVTMAALAANLSRTYNSNLGRNVIDATGLKATYDLHLTWTMEPGNGAPPEADGLSLFTALQEQLGLKLEPAKGPVEVVMIDHIEMPTAN